MAEEKRESASGGKEGKQEKPAKEESKKETNSKEKEVKVPAKFKDLVKQIEELSILELADLVKILEDKFGVSAAPMAVAAPAAAGGGEGAAGEEAKSEYDIELKDGGDQKISVIKVVKEITGLGLKEAKDMVDGAPKVIKQAVKKEEAEEFKKKLEQAGGSVELK